MVGDQYSNGLLGNVAFRTGKRLPWDAANLRQHSEETGLPSGKRTLVKLHLFGVHYPAVTPFGHLKRQIRWRRHTAVMILVSATAVLLKDFKRIP